MPRNRAVARSARVTPETFTPPALVAAATNYSQTPIKSTAAVNGAFSYKKNPPKPAAQAWQTTAWGFYDTIGEYRYACDWTGNLLSRVKLVVTQNGEPVTDQKILDVMAALYDGPEGQAEMLRMVGRHWTVTGDCYIIGDDWESDEPDWLVAASTKVTVTEDGGWKVGREEFKKSALVIRLWRPAPTDRSISDSPSQAVLPILNEIDGLTKHVAAQIDSRLAGAGILFVPSQMSFSSAKPEEPVEEGEDPPEPAAAPKASVDELVRTLIEVMSAAIQDREDPNALVPIVISADGEAIKNVKYQTFSTPLDEKAIELRREAITRLALGMDMPPEILTGTGDMNHWSSWQLEEAAIKAHLEPLLEEICASLTEQYLWPTIGGKDAKTYRITPDTTALRLRPNRSQEAIELYDRGELNGDTLRTENGFDPKADAMSDQQLQEWLTKKIAGGSATPEQVLAALEALGVKLNVKAPPAAPAADGTKGADPAAEPRESRPTPSTEKHPTQTPPAPAAQPKPGASARDIEALVSSSAVMVHRALERAGNRLSSKLGGSKIRDAQNRVVPAARAYRHVELDFASTHVDDLLADAWAPCAIFADDLGVDSTWLARSLNAYTRDLLQYGKPHTTASLRTHLQLAVAASA